MQVQDLYDQVVQIIIQETGCNEDTVKPEATLVELGVDGDDAEQLIQRFSDHFSIDMSDFRFSRHFGPEGYSLTSLINLIYTSFVFRVKKCTWEEAAGLRPIKVSDLVHIAKTKKWNL